MADKRQRDDKSSARDSEPPKTNVLRPDAAKLLGRFAAIVSTLVAFVELSQLGFAAFLFFLALAGLVLRVSQTWQNDIWNKRVDLLTIGIIITLMVTAYMAWGRADLNSLRSQLAALEAQVVTLTSEDAESPQEDVRLPSEINRLPQPSSTPSPPVECAANIIACGSPVPIYVSNVSSSVVETREPDSLRVRFTNPAGAGSGLALRFDPGLDVREFRFIEIVGTSTQTFAFEVQYKVSIASNIPEVVQTSGPHNFPEGPTQQRVNLPLRYTGVVDEVVINFFQGEQSSEVVLSTIRLLL